MFDVLEDALFMFAFVLLARDCFQDHALAHRTFASVRRKGGGADERGAALQTLAYRMCANSCGPKYQHPRRLIVALWTGLTDTTANARSSDGARVVLPP